MIMSLQPLHSTLIYGARPHENCCVKFTVKKINATILGLHSPPPHCGACEVSSYSTDYDYDY